MTGVDFPDYLKERRLPKGGPDRFRFCVLYGDAIADGKTHEQALAQAFGCLELMYWYVEAGLDVGSCGGIPIADLGEE